MRLRDVIDAAAGRIPADLLLKNGRAINVFSGTLIAEPIAVKGDRIVGFGRYEALQEVDLNQKYVAPGFIDAHVHIESSMACPSSFVQVVLPRGTTTVVADPHEIANVAGTRGIDYMLRSGQDQPMNIFFSLPSCVPATHMETAGASLGARELAPYMSRPEIAALGEMMNFPGVIAADPGVVAKIEAARRHRLAADGHAPGISGLQLNAYAAAGIASDHECTTADEALAKIGSGMWIMVREGTAARNLRNLLPAINSRTSRRMMWCTDDRHPHDLLNEGHIDSMVREAVRSGVDPFTAVQMATLNPAEYFGFDHLGAISPGRQADLVVFDSLENFRIERVYCRGRLAAESGALSPSLRLPPVVSLGSTLQVDADRIDFKIGRQPGQIRVIDIIADQIVTGQFVTAPRIENGWVCSDPKADILKIAVVERHRGTGNIGKGFVRGLGLKQGAIASSVAHDAHNLVVAGVDDRDLHVAAEAVLKAGGGLSVAAGGTVLETLALPIAGLMSSEPLQSIQAQVDRLLDRTRQLGSRLADPFMTLSFLALAVIPELKITDQGLVDVTRFEQVPLFCT